MTIETNSRKRMSPEMTKKMINMLSEEHDQTKKSILRELTAAVAEKKTKGVTLKTTFKGDFQRRKFKGKDNGGKYKPYKGQWGQEWQYDRPLKKGKGKKKGQQQWGDNNTWNDWGNGNWWAGKGIKPTQEADQNKTEKEETKTDNNVKK